MALESEKYSGEDMSKYDWIHLNPTYARPETFTERSMRKFHNNPMVPIGCIMTAGALTYGLYSFYRGDTIMSQRMMRTRVVAQGFTVFAVLAGIALSAGTSKDE